MHQHIEDTHISILCFIISSHTPGQSIRDLPSNIDYCRIYHIPLASPDALPRFPTYPKYIPISLSHYTSNYFPFFHSKFPSFRLSSWHWAAENTKHIAESTYTNVYLSFTTHFARSPWKAETVDYEPPIPVG